MWADYINANSIEQVLLNLSQAGKRVKIIAGGTDLMLEIQRGQHPDALYLVDISRVTELRKIHLDDDGFIHLGALVTHSDVLASQMLRQYAFPLVMACWEVGSAQIRNMGTIVGNLVTASPANDTITPLIALDARLLVKSIRGSRVIPLGDFYRGVRRTQLEPDELVTEVLFKALLPERQGAYLKIALRRAQAISVVNASAILNLDQGLVKKAVITLGAVAPTIIRAIEAEEYLVGKTLDDRVIDEASKRAAIQVSPISDIRSSAEYRRRMVVVATRRVLSSIMRREYLRKLPDHPVLLRTEGLEAPVSVKDEISLRINGKEYHFDAAPPRSLLQLLREDARLTGSKEGCSEGECGACTVIMNDKAVLSCLIPAPRAHGSSIITIEGLGSGEGLTSLQQAFIDCGAVQCGYCTPGFIMSSTMLLKEVSRPTKNQIQQALEGNLCRCTGYYKIIEAVQKAAERG